jgi:hypothetical protein
MEVNGHFHIQASLLIGKEPPVPVVWEAGLPRAILKALEKNVSA